MSNEPLYQVGDRVRVVRSDETRQQCIYPGSTVGWIYELMPGEDFYCVLLEGFACSYYEGNQLEHNVEGDETLEQYMARERARLEGSKPPLDEQRKELSEELREAAEFYALEPGPDCADFAKRAAALEAENASLRVQIKINQAAFKEAWVEPKQLVSALADARAERDALAAEVDGLKRMLFFITSRCS